MKIGGQRWIWITAVASSVVLVAFVLSLVDWQLAEQVVAGANRPLILVGVGLLALEGFLTAARFKLLSTKEASYAQCLRASGVVCIIAPSATSATRRSCRCRNNGALHGATHWR